MLAIEIAALVAFAFFLGILTGQRKRPRLQPAVEALPDAGPYRTPDTPVFVVKAQDHAIEFGIGEATYSSGICSVCRKLVAVAKDKNKVVYHVFTENRCAGTEQEPLPWPWPVRIRRG